MNQAILFPDSVEWLALERCLQFHAQCQGLLIQCLVPVEVLEKHASVTISTEAEAIALFEELRFDCEEQAEALIDDERYNELGQVIVEHL